MAIEVGSVVEGEVTGITNFGAFLQLPEGKTGLIHISEVSNVYVKDIRDFLKEHQKVRVKVLSIDARGKIALSLKQVAEDRDNQETPEKSVRPKMAPAPEKRAPHQAVPLTFEDKLSKFMKDSDDRLLDLRRNTESKRGGRGASRVR